MSHLATVYGKDLGVRVGKPILQSHYYPLPSNKYITIHTSDKVPAKNYSYWNDVVTILKPELDRRGYSIIQIGTKEDPQIDGVNCFLNSLTFQQTFFVIENSLLHVGIDSCPVHIASAYNIPTVSVYAHTYASTCSPLWNRKQIIIESDRGGNRPSFSLVENPKTIDLIKPEEISEACFKLLNFKKFKSQKTIYIGSKYLSKTIDVILGDKFLEGRILDAKVRIRMDLFYCEKRLVEQLSKIEKAEILTKSPISTNILTFFKNKIAKVVYTCERFNEDFLSFLRNSNIAFELNCTNNETISEERNKFFNYDICLEEGNDIPKEIREKITENYSNMRISTGKIYLINGEKVISPYNFKKDDFWIDAKYFRFYTTT